MLVILSGYLHFIWQQTYAIMASSAASGVGPVGGDDFFSAIFAGDVVVVGKFHVITTAALGHGNEIVGIAEHLGEGNLSFLRPRCAA